MTNGMTEWRPCGTDGDGAAAAVVARPLVDLADGREVQLRDIELVWVEHLVERAVERGVGLQKTKEAKRYKPYRISEFIL